MDKVKLAKFAAKFVVGAVGSAAIGYLIKGERLIGAKIEDYFDSKTSGN